MDIVVLALLALVVIGALLIRAKKGGRLRSAFPYERRDMLVTRAERSFLGVLDQAVAGEYRIFSKVRVADVLKPKKGLDRSTWFKAFNQISAKHFDFVLCDPKTIQIKAVIELNDKSHKSRKRAERDEFLLEACAAAGVPLLEFTARRSYAIEAIRSALSKVEANSENPREFGSLAGPVKI